MLDSSNATSFVILNSSLSSALWKIYAENGEFYLLRVVMGRIIYIIICMCVSNDDQWCVFMNDS